MPPRYKASPVFGLAGFVLPAEAVRGFGTWFFRRKCELLAFEIRRSGEHPALWEKKGSGLYTFTNVIRIPEVRRFTNRLFNKIDRLGGFVFYLGARKTAAPVAHNPNRLNKRPHRIRNVGFASRRPARIMLLSGFMPRHGKLSIFSVPAWMDLPCLETARYFPF